MKPLSPKREAFCLEFLKHNNATTAYKQVFRMSPAAKPETVWNQAYKLMQREDVAARIAELRAQAAKDAGVKAADVLMEAARIAFSDIRRAFKDDGTLMALHELDDNTAAAISSVKVRQIVGDEGDGLASVTEIRMWDKNSALDKLMRNLGMFRLDNEQRDDLPVKSADALTAGFEALREAFGLILREPAGTA